MPKNIISFSNTAFPTTHDGIGHDGVETEKVAKGN